VKKLYHAVESVSGRGETKLIEGKVLLDKGPGKIKKRSENRR